MFVRQCYEVDQRDQYSAELPRIPSAVRALAVHIANDARSVLAHAEARMLSASRQQRGKPQLSLWNAGLAPDRDLLRRCRAEPATARQLRHLENNAAGLIDHLASRWPVTHMPEALGFITDGSGIALSPDDPCPARPGWILSHVSGETRLTVILPFAGATPWGAIQPVRPGTRHH